MVSFSRLDRLKNKMTSAGDVTVTQDGPGNVKLHPYLVTLVRWCVSCLWSTATVLLQRIMIAPLQPITGPKPSKPAVARRAAGTEHLHPEPKVECQLLHQPEEHTLDVVFVHGLYGSLGNTWRQGEWKTKYEQEPKKVTLRNHSEKTCNCQKITPKIIIDNKNDCSEKDKSVKRKAEDKYTIDLHETEMTINKVNQKLFKKIIPNENDLITEQFYNNTLLDQIEIVDNYDTQANFVRDLFKRETNCDNVCDDKSDDQYKCKYDKCNKKCKCEQNDVNNEDECKCNDKKCEVGCGCICDDCYSSCWPRDWIKKDFPGARVISVNYTSDPYLWRPLWIKENKRLSLQVRADQMMEQLLAMKVGEKPVVWVGHSKGGLFIKQIYCQAYEAYKKLNKTDTPVPELKKNADFLRRVSSINNDAVLAETIENIVGNMFDKQMHRNNDSMTFSDYKEQKLNEKTKNDKEKERNSTNELKCEVSVKLTTDIVNLTNDGVKLTERVNLTTDGVNSADVSVNNKDNCKITDDNGNVKEFSCEAESSNIEEVRKARLYSQSRGFMFYSVPHRGSPLADIKTPVTARSLELLEISKDCPLVLTLHSRWLEACSGASAGVRGVVETGRTLMSLLWLTIVSEQSADAGIGTLLGVSVDHREICKPSSRYCMLYTELVQLINEALSGCDC